jgi:hypothetical protein
MSSSLGNQIVRLREMRGFNQGRLGGAANVSRAERDEVLPTFDNMRAMAITLGAECNLMASYMLALGKKERRQTGAPDFTVAVPDCLLAAPLATLNPDLKFRTIDEEIEWSDLDEEEIGKMEEDVQCAVLPGLSDGSPAPGLDFPRGAYPVATLSCQFSADALDIVWLQQSADRKERFSFDEYREKPHLKNWPLQARGWIVKALVASRQSVELTEATLKNFPEIHPDKQELCMVLMEPLTSKVLGKTAHLPPRQVHPGSQRFSIELHFLTDGFYGFDGLRTEMTNWALQVDERISLLNSDRALEGKSVGAIAEAFATSEDVVRDFMSRARPNWRLSLYPEWLRGKRSV